MKFISAVLCVSMFRSAAAESCPDELPGKVELNGAGLAFHYGILENDQALCGKLVSDTEAWVGFAAQPEGIRQMIGAKSVIALPQANTVQQYMLNAKNTAGIVPTESQTLTETTVDQEDGTTVATFKQPLSDNGLTLTSNNVYLLAKGFSNDLGYHVSRGFVTLDFETNVITSPTTANPTSYPSLQPSLKLSSPPSLKSSSPPSMNSSSQPSLKSSSSPSMNSSSQPSLKSSSSPSMNSSSQPSLKSSSPPSLNSSSHPSSQPTQNTTTQTSSKPSSPPSLGSTAATSSVESTPLVTTNTTTYPSSQPSNSPLSQSSSKPSSKPSTQSSSSPSSLPSAEPSSLPSTKLSSLPSSELQTSGTSTPSSASPSQLTSSPLSLKPSANPSRFLTDNSQPVPITEDKDPTSSSQRKVFSMGMAMSTVACVLLATVSW